MVVVELMVGLTLIGAAHPWRPAAERGRAATSSCRAVMVGHLAADIAPTTRNQVDTAAATILESTEALAPNGLTTTAALVTALRTPAAEVAAASKCKATPATTQMGHAVLAEACSFTPTAK